jgi:hypothetical protein
LGAAVTAAGFDALSVEVEAGDALSVEVEAGLEAE